VLISTPKRRKGGLRPSFVLYITIRRDGVNTVSERARTEWVGGYLNKQEILDNLDRMFVPGTVADPEKQVQQAGIDLTLSKVFRGGVGLPFLGSEGWVSLPKGSYWVEFCEKARGSKTLGLTLFPRSTHFRGGGTLDCGRGKRPELWRGKIEAHLTVENPFGIRLQRGVRLSQALVCSSSIKFSQPHYGVAVSEPLTVEKIFAYRSEGILGIDERGVETEEVERVTLSGGTGYLMRFAETIRVGNDEVVFSFGDNPHREIQQGHMQTRPVVSPYTGLMSMGAVADPGYYGQLNACVYSSWGQTIYAGVPLLRVAKHLITPVGDEHLYDGKYQGTGVTADMPETVVWDKSLAWAL